MDELIIRDERTGDELNIERVVREAFAGDAEARLVAALRIAGRLSLSLVAENAGELVGHVAFSPVDLAGAPVGWGLAPVAVRPALQRRSIGSRLIRAGIDRAARAGAPFLVVLGDPLYYSRFGFQPARSWRLRDEYGGGDAFQAIVSKPNCLPVEGGLVRYSPEFAIFES